MDDLEKKLDILEKKCTNLDTRCELLQRSVQILGKESNWEYSAPPIPLSHWRGLPEDNIRGMQKLVRSIKGYTCALRSGELKDTGKSLPMLSSYTRIGIL